MHVNRLSLLLAAFAALTPAASGQSSNMALSVDGSDSALQVPVHASLEPTDAITIEAWIKGFGGTGKSYIARKAWNGGDGYMLQWSVSNSLGGGVECMGFLKVNDPKNNSNYLGSWHHLAFTSEAGREMNMYVDGELVDTDVAPGCFQHTDDLWIGAHQGTSDEFIGWIDELRIWNVVRTQTEIQEVMNRSIDSGPGLVSVWHLDGDGTDSVSGNTGFLFGDAVFVDSDSPVGEPATPWIDLGEGLAGTNGLVPVLTGSGSLDPASNNAIVLTSALPGSTAHLVFGLALLGAPFKGGLMVPTPDWTILGLPVVGGGVSLPFYWPVGIPSGSRFYAQQWVVDPNGPSGFSASNGLEGEGQ